MFSSEAKEYAGLGASLAIDAGASKMAVSRRVLRLDTLALVMVSSNASRFYLGNSEK